jgi:peptide/nickel transport system permease protein
MHCILPGIAEHGADSMKLKMYILQRLVMLIPLMLIVSLIVFTLVYLCPGDAVDRMMGLEQVAREKPNLEEYLKLKEIFGLDEPWHIQYYCWLRQAVQGNLGYSFFTGRPVLDEIIDRIPNTLSYQIIALVLSVAISIPAGVISALKQNTITDTYVVMGSLFGASFPPFVTGLLLILLFTLALGWFPWGGTHSMEYIGNVPHDVWYYLDYVKHLILPTLVMTVATVGYTTRLVRSSMLNVLKEDYILTARSKGLKERVVIYKHALKNAILPIVTVIGLRVAMLLGGAPVVEVVFTWPGLGIYFVRAVWYREYFAVIAAALVLSVLILAANLLVDISYKFLDPRVEL